MKKIVISIISTYLVLAIVFGFIGAMSTIERNEDLLNNPYSSFAEKGGTKYHKVVPSFLINGLLFPRIVWNPCTYLSVHSQSYEDKCVIYIDGGSIQ